MIANSSLSRRLAGLSVAAVCLAAATPASADFVPSGGGSYAGVPLYRALVFGGIDTQAGISPGYLSQDIFDGVDYASNTSSIGTATGGGTRSANGATLTGNGWAADSGFLASRNYASIAVGNAQAGDDYYLVAGQGGTRQVHLEANAPVSAATFVWTLSGSTSTSGLGTANSRLDFGVTTSPGSDWNDMLYGVGETALTAFGPGSYSYTAALSGVAMDLYLYYWTSAFTVLTHDTFSTGSNATLTADFGSTYVLQGLQLFDEMGATITNWTMTDATSGEALFDQTGRLAAVAPSPNAVPEPTSGALALAALGVLGWTRQRRARPGPADMIG